MEEMGIQVQHSQADADYDIPKPACNIALTKPVAVVGDDADLLILIQHHFNPTVCDNLSPDKHKAQRHFCLEVQPQPRPQPLNPLNSWLVWV